MSTPTPKARIAELERILAGLLDGIDGYESQVGDLHPFWNPAPVQAARAYFDALPDSGHAAGYWLANPKQPPSK